MWLSKSRTMSFSNWTVQETSAICFRTRESSSQALTSDAEKVHARETSILIHKSLLQRTLSPFGTNNDIVYDSALPRLQYTVSTYRMMAIRTWFSCSCSSTLPSSVLHLICCVQHFNNTINKSKIRKQYQSSPSTITNLYQQNNVLRKQIQA